MSQSPPQSQSRDIDQQSVAASSRLSFTDSLNPDRSIWYILALTFILGSLQMAWTVEFSECTPFLLTNLGLSKAILALVWIAGPLSGTIGQPIVGILSDNSNVNFGRRRPFILGGCLVICITLILLSHSVDIIGLIVGNNDKDYVKKKTVPFAIAGIYILDFSISAFQAASRALIVDMVPSHQQQVANSWAARMIGFFNIGGFWLASLDLTKSVFYGHQLDESAQFKAMSGLAVLILVLITGIGCYIVKERNPRNDPLIIEERKKTTERLKDLGIVTSPTRKPNFFQLLYSIYKQTISSLMRLSPQVKNVNSTEFLAWIGYFPMLFYTTTYVGEIYIYQEIQKMKLEDPRVFPLSEEVKTFLTQKSTRVGSLALLVNSISSLAFNIIIPKFAKSSRKMNFSEGNDESEIVTENNSLSWFNSRRGYRLLNASKKSKISVKWVWTFSHLVFVLCTVSTFFIKSSTMAIIMFGFMGIPWGSALWAPFVLIAEEITRIKEKKTRYGSMRQENKVIEDGNGNETVMSSSTSNLLSENSNNIIVNNNKRRVKMSKLRKYMEYEHESGIILGVHNVFVSAPQVISSLFSSVLFKLLSGNNNDKWDGAFDTSLGWVFRFGGLMAIGAAIISLRVKTNEELESLDVDEVED